MEAFQENTFLYNVTAGIVVLVLFLLVLKFVESLAKTLLIFMGVLIVGYGLIQFFPHVAEPVARFVGLGWINDTESSSTEASHPDSEKNTYFDSSTDYSNNSSGTYNNIGAHGDSTRYNYNRHQGSSADDSGDTDNNSETFNDSHNYPTNHSYDISNPNDDSDTYDDVDNYY